MLEYLIDFAALPAPSPSYTLASLPSPPLEMWSGVPCLVYGPPAPTSTTPVIVYAHANGTDLGELRPILHRLCRATAAYVVAPEYPGYGARHCERVSINATISTVVRTVLDVHDRWPHASRVLLLGRSIGTGIATQAALKLQQEHRLIDALVLISPFASLERMGIELIGSVGASAARGCLDTKATLPTLVPTLPVLLLHGRLDEMIPIAHSKSLERTRHRIELIELPLSTHNDLDWRSICAIVSRFIKDA
jgi:pimeloyl-ACP methyl ester carboxylesterase